MDLAFSLLILWALLFLPAGLVIHSLVLGKAARERALPLAPITGIAAAFVLLSFFGRLGVKAGQQPVIWGVLLLSLVCVLAIWRLKIVWWSKEFGGALALLVLALMLVQMPVVGQDGDGPLGYGTVANPVSEVAAIDAAVGGETANQQVARSAGKDASERPIAFEQFSALTVGIGTKATGVDDSWSAYSLHSAITGVLAALVSLPLFAFARARGMKWLGLIFLVLVGVLTPYTFLALANGSGAAIASIPMFGAAVFTLLVTKRDRGWWALAMLFGAALAVSAGALAIIPLLIMGVVWMFVRATTYEHLAQADTPVGTVRALFLGLFSAALASFSVAYTLRSGELLAWPKLHTTMLGALRSWPFAWLDTNLATAGPIGRIETAVWLVGPALLVVAAVHGVIRNERRELAVLAGSALAAVIAVVIGLIETDAGIRLFEYTVLLVSPFLAALAVRAVTLARDKAEDVTERGKVTYVVSWLPAIFATCFVVISLAATSVTGARMVHAPALMQASIEPGNAIIAGGDPWLAFIVNGERVPGGYADSDVLASKAGKDHIALSEWDTLVLANSPLGSDPPTRFAENTSLDSYQARLFYDKLTHPTAASSDLVLNSEIMMQRRFRSAAAERAAVDSGSTKRERKEENDAAVKGKNIPTAIALRHDPLEGVGERITPEKPAGLLLPDSDISGCDSRSTSIIEACNPSHPLVAKGCTKNDVRAARSYIDGVKPEQVRAGQPLTRVPEGSEVLEISADDDLSINPPLLGVQCFDVSVDALSRSLMLHVRNIGLILPPEDADIAKKQKWSTERFGPGGVAGGVRLKTSTANARIEYGPGRLSVGSFDVTVEGSFGAGVTLQGLVPQVMSSSGDVVDGKQPPLAFLRGAANGFGMITRDAALAGSATLENTSGTDIELGRVFARPRDIPASCNIALGIRQGERRELRLESEDAAAGSRIQRPGVTVVITDVNGSGKDRTARVAVGSYLAYGGMPRYLLLDWVEQYAAPFEVEGCSGEQRTEQGIQAPTSKDVLVNRGSLQVFGRAG